MTVTTFMRHGHQEHKHTHVMGACAPSVYATADTEKKKTNQLIHPPINSLVCVRDLLFSAGVLRERYV